MLGPIAEFVKRYRHEVGKHTLVVGSGTPLRPSPQTVQQVIEEVALREAGAPATTVPPDLVGEDAVARWAQKEPDHPARCRLVTEAMGQVRPSEGHIRLARMVKDGYFSTVFWCAPDNLIEQALEQQRLERDRDYNLLYVGITDEEEVRVAVAESTRVTLVKVGGHLPGQFLPLTPEEFRSILDPVRKCVSDVLRPLLVITAYTSRDRELLALVPGDGDKVFWVNRVVPVETRERYDGLRAETPAAAKVHAHLPEVTALLARRGSARNLIVREAGDFDAFFGKLHHRLQRRRSSEKDGRKDLTVLPGGPYRYLDYFDVRHADLFHGREKDTERLRKLIADHPVTVLCGPAGVGTSSLLRAGVAAAMVAEEKESDERPAAIPVVVSCVGDPVDDIIRGVTSTLYDRGWLSTPSLASESFVDAMVEASEAGQCGMVALVDNVAHLFARRGPATRRGFAEMMAACAERLGDRWRVCLAIRDEFLGYLVDLQEFWPGLLGATMRLGRLSQQDVVDAIMKPGPAFYCYPETELADRVAADLEDGGVLPAHVQIIMDRLYESRSWGSHSLTVKMYEQLGGAEAILAECVEFPLSQLGQVDRRAARTILKRLVGSQRTTVPKSLDRLVAETRLPRDAVERMLARLLDLRLVRAVGREGRRQYELVHAYLAEEIGTWLSDRLTAATKFVDAISRTTDEWLHTKAVPPARLLQRMQACRDDIDLSDWEMEALLRAAATHDIDLKYWLKRIEEFGDRRIPILRRLLHDDDQRVRRAAADALSQAVDQDALSTLVDGLHDEDETVRERATATLESHDRELIGTLQTEEPMKRQRAAHALGIVGTERHVRPLVGALRDGDDEFTDQATRALSQISATQAEALLLRRLVQEPDAPWSVAYALGHLATDAKTLQALESARSGAAGDALAKVGYAIGRARLTRGDLDEAAEALHGARESAADLGGRRAIDLALAELTETRARSSTADPPDWPLFGGDSAHAAFRRRSLKLPLTRRWAFKTNDSVIASPVVAKGFVYIGSRDGNLYCLDVNTGAAVWKAATRDRIEASAAYADEVVVFAASNGTVQCVDAMGGARRWTVRTGSPIRAALNLAEGRVIIAARTGSIIALALSNGERLWSFDARAEVVASPAVSGDHIVFGSWDRTIRCLHAATGEMMWRFPAAGEVSASPATGGPCAYCPADSGHVYAIDLDSGEEVWHQHMAPPARSSPAVTDEVVIVGDAKGQVAALTTEVGNRLWQSATGEEVSGSPAVAGDLVLVGSADGSLRALDLRTGEERWKERTAYGIYSSPAIAGDMVFVGMNYYDVWAFAHEPNIVAPGADADL
jgi:outer membrane protein assembly factor BamB/HEAT repeat protein